jgi:t-SNARE complex subunit (syntaxin)
MSFRSDSLVRFAREQPFACWLIVFLAMMLCMMIGAVHHVGGDRALLGNWANVRW